MIHIQNLVKFHGQQRILSGVTLTVGRGKVAVIVGPSGGGKSTLLRCVNGLETFHEGEIRIEDTRLPAVNARLDPQALRRIRQRVGMVFQQFHLFPHMTVLANVMAGPRIALGVSRAEAEQIARPLLQRVGLADKMDARPDTLSGGQQQRVAIARTLAMKPAAILFDEPTSALDPRMASEVLSVIAELAASGQTMLVVTHAMDFARRVAHTVHVMQAGRMVESGPPAQIFNSPKEPATRTFLLEPS